MRGTISNDISSCEGRLWGVTVLKEGLPPRRPSVMGKQVRLEENQWMPSSLLNKT